MKITKILPKFLAKSYQVEDLRRAEIQLQYYRVMVQNLEYRVAEGQEELKRLKKYCNNEVFKGFLTFFPNNRFYILSEEVEHLPDKKVFKERKVLKTTGVGEKKEELVPVYYDLLDIKS